VQQLIVVLQHGIGRCLHDGNGAFAGKVGHESFLHIEFGADILPDRVRLSNPLRYRTSLRLCAAAVRDDRSTAH
jgi:hypothetical protein